MLTSKSAMEARPEPTAVPLTRARPSLGCSSKKPPGIPAARKASAAERGSPAAVTALALGRPVRRPAM